MTRKYINLVSGTKIKIIEKTRDFSLYRTRQDSGEGIVTQYLLLDGAILYIMD